MTIADPIPDLQWGKGDWQDYINNWREKDAEWIQARTILRYQTAAARTTDWASPSAGQVTYNDAIGALEMYSAVKTAWLHLLMFQYLVSTADTTTGVNISHASAGGKGATFTPTSLLIDANLNAINGTLTVDGTGVGVQTPTMKKALLTTNATELVSDTPLAVPSVRLTASSGNVIDATGKAIVTGALTASSITTPGGVTATGTVTAGALSTSGALSAGSATIGGVGVASNIVTTPAGTASANAAGVQSGQGYFYGDGNSAVMRQRADPTQAAGAAYVQAQANSVVLNGPTAVQLLGGDVQIRNGNNLDFYNAAGTKLGVGIGPVVNSASDPGAANYPEGTIWIS